MVQRRKDLVISEVVKMEEERYKIWAVSQLQQGNWNLRGCDQQGHYVGRYVVDIPSKAELPYQGHIQYPSQSSNLWYGSEDTC